MKLEALLEKVTSGQPPATTQAQFPANAIVGEEEGIFAEPISGKFKGLLNVRASAIFLILGGIMAATVGNVIKGYLPAGIGKYATLIAGLFLVILSRSNYMLRSFGFGVFIEGVVEVAKDFRVFQSFSEDRNMYAETKETWGGTDGVYPVQPDRKTFS